MLSRRSGANRNHNRSALVRQGYYRNIFLNISLTIKKAFLSSLAMNLAQRETHYKALFGDVKIYFEFF